VTAALVTGGSRGIGRAIVERLARDGASVVFSYERDENAAAEVVAAVRAGGGRAFAVQADQGRSEDLQRLAEEAERHLGGVDILVCNAGINPPVGILDATEADFDRVMAVNAKGPYFLMQLVGRKLPDGGRIINISSLSTAIPVPGSSLYVGSKAALEQFTAVAAREFGGRRITVNCISPGATDTELLRTANPGQTFEDTKALTALRRLGEPADIANVVAFLAGPDSAWITGQNLRVTGGMLL
jgi:3-oxoacyl-[acyl-carrier protein] reductase